MIIIIFILFYLLPIFLIHIIGLYFWKKRTDCGKTIGDMYEYYDAADGNPLVIFTWVPLANIFILLAGFIIFFYKLNEQYKNSIVCILFCYYFMLYYSCIY